MCIRDSSKAQPSSTSNAPETNMNSKQVFSPVHCSINCISNDQQMWVNITFSNVMESSVTFLERNLVRTSDLTWSPFQVSRNGQNVPYMGLTIKRPPPTASEFYHMKPHEVVNTRIEIGKFYDFSSSGNYVIKYIACLLYTSARQGTVKSGHSSRRRAGLRLPTR